MATSVQDGWLRAFLFLLHWSWSLMFPETAVPFVPALEELR